MPYELKLPLLWSNQRWKVKVYDSEGPEEPHVSILRRNWTWRVGLRSFEFLDRLPDGKDVPRKLLDLVRSHSQELQNAWDALHPANPVFTTEDDDA